MKKFYFLGKCYLNREHSNIVTAEMTENPIACSDRVFKTRKEARGVAKACEIVLFEDLDKVPEYNIYNVYSIFVIYVK